jgi:excisionase family DNA binding protein
MGGKDDVLERWDELWDARKTAKELKLTVDYLYELVREDAVPHVRRGRLVRFEPEQVRRWDRSRTRVLRLAD